MYDRKEQQVITRVHECTEIREKSVVLTFDDGPGRYLTKILDVLRDENVPAMFFWQTRLLYPQRSWKRVLDEGHIIGSHSVNHPDLRRMDYLKQYNELFASKEKIERITGQNVRYFRPPFGQFNSCTLKAVFALNMVPVMWSAASFDWELKGQPELIVSNVISNLEDGAVILLHELPQTLFALPELIKQIRDQGYTFTLLPQ